MPAFFLLQAFLLLLSDNVNNLIVESDNLIPKNWFEMYGKREIDTFFKPVLQSYFQLVIMFICLLIFFIGSYLARSKELEKFIINSAILLIIINFFYSTIEYFIFNVRASGVTDNPQALGVVLFSALLLVFFLSNNSLKRIICSFMVFSIVFFSGTKSSLASLIIIFILLINQSNRLLNLSLYGVILINFLSTVIFVLLFGEDMILLLSYLFSDTSTMLIRVLMWSSAFYNIIIESPVFGLFGRISEFPDNIIWYFLVSYGFLGFLIYLLFFFKITRKNNKYLNLLVFALFFQGLSYYGYMVKPMSYIFWFCLGFMYERACNYEK